MVSEPLHSFTHQHHVLLRGPSLIEGREDEHDLVAGNSKVFQLPQDFCPILELVIVISSQGQDCTNQEEEGRVVKDRPNGFVQRACDKVVG